MPDNSSNQGTTENILRTANTAQFEGQVGQKEQLQQAGQLDTASFLDGVRTALRALEQKSEKNAVSSTPEQVLNSINALIEQLPDNITPQDVDKMMAAGMAPLEKGLRTLGQSRQMSISMGSEQLTNYAV